MDILWIYIYISHMQPMVLVFKNLHAWVILDKGKCWDSHSSTMVRTWLWYILCNMQYSMLAIWIYSVPELKPWGPVFLKVQSQGVHRGIGL